MSQVSTKVTSNTRSDDHHSSTAASTAGPSTITATPPLVLEVCVDSVASARAAERGGAKRVELCTGLVDGGLTPSLGLIKQVRVSIQIELMVLIRPRPGDFCYSEDELEIIHEDIEACKHVGADGVVIGMLHPNGSIDEALVSRCLEWAHPMKVTFHRAIDMTPDLIESAKVLMRLGIKRVLTSGGCANAIEGQATIKSLVDLCGDRLIILAGGGLTETNIPAFVRSTGVSEVHASIRTDWVFGRMEYRKENIYMGGEKKNDGLYTEYATKVADETRIRMITHRVK